MSHSQCTLQVLKSDTPPCLFSCSGELSGGGRVVLWLSAHNCGNLTLAWLVSSPADHLTGDLLSDTTSAVFSVGLLPGSKGLPCGESHPLFLVSELLVDKLRVHCVCLVLGVLAAFTILSQKLSHSEMPLRSLVSAIAWGRHCI